MESFYRPGTMAVGLCKFCGRGLDRDHMTESENGIVCKDRCEEKMLRVDRLIEHNIKNALAYDSNLGKTRNQTLLSACIILFVILTNIMILLDINLHDGIVCAVIFCALIVAVNILQRKKSVPPHAP